MGIETHRRPEERESEVSHNDGCGGDDGDGIDDVMIVIMMMRHR